MSKSKDRARSEAGLLFRDGKLVQMAPKPPEDRYTLSALPEVKPENLPEGGKVMWVPGRGVVVVRVLQGVRARGRPVMVSEPLRTCKVCDDIVALSVARPHIRRCWKIEIKDTDPIPPEPPAHLMEEKARRLAAAAPAVTEVTAAPAVDQPAASAPVTVPSIDLKPIPPMPEPAPAPVLLICRLCNQPINPKDAQDTVIVNGQPWRVHHAC